ncbi:hypothetical protein BKA69DRAFT_1121998 [Paraphysoderma sedebokerense]|nr:hypothetical protein BKA69DRAFT_1121998 [Paraphysoderma sedebokerense]
MVFLKQPHSASSVTAQVAYYLATKNILIDEHNHLSTSSTNPSPYLDLDLTSLFKSGVENVYGSVPEFVAVTDPLDPALNLLGPREKGHLPTIYTASSSLLPLLPHLYSIAHSVVPTSLVLHVSAQSDNYVQSYTDQSDIFALRSTGFAILCSNNVQESHDMAIVSAIASISSGVPFIHFFDSKRTSHEIVNLCPLTGEKLKRLVSETSPEIIESLKSDHDVSKHKNDSVHGVQSPTAYTTQSAAVASRLQETVGHLVSIFNKLAPHFGRTYAPFEYFGPSNAKKVIVTLGSCFSVIQATLATLNLDKEIGILKIRVYRPWSDAHFIQALPKSVEVITIVEQLDEADRTDWGPLLLDVTASLHSKQYQGEAGDRKIPLLTSAIYSSTIQDFRPSFVHKIAHNLSSNHPISKLILDSSTLTLTSPTPDIIAPSTKQFIIWDESSTHSKHRIVALLSSLSNGPASFQYYNVEFRNGPTKHISSHLRVSPSVNHDFPANLIASADFTAIHSISVFDARPSVLLNAKPSSIVLINTSLNDGALYSGLPDYIKYRIAHSKLRIFVIDSEKILSTLGSNVDVDNSVILNLALVQLTQTIDSELAALLLKSFAHRAPITAEVFGAVWNGLVRHDVPSEWELLEDKVVDADLPEVKEPTVMLSPKVYQNPYLKILNQAFNERLYISNVDEIPSVFTPSNGTNQLQSTSPSFGYGLHLSYLSKYKNFKSQISSLVRQPPNTLSPELVALLSKYSITQSNSTSYKSLVTSILPLLETEHKRLTDNINLAKIYRDRDLFNRRSLWLVVNDTFAKDFSYEAFHSLIASNENINLLIIDSTPVVDAVNEPSKRKKDLALHALEYGKCYVASTAVYSSYTQVLHACMEAERFDGPSVVFGYLPSNTISLSADETPINALKETKVAVDSGYWPLYRYNPVLEAENKDPFTLDSERLKESLAKFLDRENQLSLLAATLPTSHHTTLEQKTEKSLVSKVQNSFSKLLSGLTNSGPPVLVLFGSDGGNAENLANRFARQATHRGLTVRVSAMDDFPTEELSAEPTVIFFISTAGQGEFPSNAREFYKALSNATDINLSTTQFAVFGLGDSHYWPRPEDAHYFCKPAKDLHSLLIKLGGAVLVDPYLGDDQDADGFETQYKLFEPTIFPILGVSATADGIEEPKPKTDDDIKVESNYLRGTILEGLADTSTGALAPLDTKLTKFHGIYQQDDRDLRDSRKKQGLEPAYSFMIRVRVPGGIATPEQYLAMDTLSTTHANNTLKITTRQAFQFHGVIKAKLKPTMQKINASLMDTIAACGDVNRNVMAGVVPGLIAEDNIKSIAKNDSSNPEKDGRGLVSTRVHEQVFQFSKDLSDHLTPRTTAYHEIWLDKKLLKGGEKDVEPIYGETYLPRKFKIAIAVPPSNDVDVFAHDLGFIAIVENDNVIGYNVTVGGGMGATHNNKKTYPRIASPLCFVTPSEAILVAETIVKIQRDNGDRTNRKHARLKYTLDDRSIDWMKSEIVSRLNLPGPLTPPKPYHFAFNGDQYGWMKSVDHKTGEEMYHFGMWVSNGRIKDTENFQLKTGLREVAKVHKGDFRLTANQGLVIGNIKKEDKHRIETVLKKFGLDKLQFSGMRLNSLACVALPTCALAMAESERYLPTLLTEIEQKILLKHNIYHDPITIRMTGCPNGCARPYIAEIGLVGKAPGSYNLFLGAGFVGERVGKLYKESINEQEIMQVLDELLGRWSKERKSESERFGEWCIRAGIVKPVLESKTDFHD